MARHSEFNKTEAKTCFGASLLPFRTSCKGPVNTSKVGIFDGEGDDIVEEAINYYRYNVFFRSFEVQGGADRVLIYLTLFISSCLARIEKISGVKDAEKALQAFAWEGIAVPGQQGFPFNAFFEAAKSPGEADDFKAYLKQLREETAMRLVARVYGGDGAPSKLWVPGFSRRKFMNATMA
mmetsp:Transcript_1915/g.5060  ORF Transcript_1915/g.5060 Transcript_1915/m.5060 type:complete len:180 (+) Transcript_1915:34-573(+)